MHDVERPRENAHPRQNTRPEFISALEWLARTEGSYRGLAALGAECLLPREWADCLEVRVRYLGYIERQQRGAARAAPLETLPLPADLWETPLAGVSIEAREKLRRWKPASVGQAGRIAGISPADVAVLMMLARRHTDAGAAAQS